VQAKASEALDRLDEITRRLRRECPWDREQDERSIVPHTVEEAYELADAAASGDDAKLLDELGDVLFQVHFLALLLEERGAGSLTEVAEGMIAKLIRRHPHVFGETEADTAGEVLANWDKIKRDLEGRGAGEDPFADVPEVLPALLHARKVQRRAGSRLGRDEPEISELESGIREALSQIGQVASAGGSGAPTADEAVRERVESAVGDALFSLVELARVLRVDPELALRAATRRFEAAMQG
jgi:MazG family protein